MANIMHHFKYHGRDALKKTQKSKTKRRRKIKKTLKSKRKR